MKYAKPAKNKSYAMMTEFTAGFESICPLLVLGARNRHPRAEHRFGDGARCSSRP
jgi:hypothetical protein